ncbi:TetR/AcrR family transcriptional repressor of lmrAB and yxaGH operons [Kitasatospora sp. MAA19]|uniref:TetR/AcrR family transcriptional regulator n=1 Tax=Kitasatospora sp. MAA19 TaxID=3035090 RepID=UPI0024769013|nr:TetR/AcrR family transcriptional regulator [Kitasatospora sp. MAA19]MDH6708909.1 TetR/AcrR family transcriptional repressor of lmrAB and yxaGH operons [Kitasatospora sp. MAA19]
MGVKGEETRARLIAGTRTLIEAQGYFGTGLNQIVAEAGAPRGSLYFHFPEGKDQLVAAALTQAGQEVGDLLASLAAEGADSGALTERLTEVFAERLARSDYTKGCPIATVALEVAGTNEPLRAVCAEVYESWQRVLAGRLETEGFRPAEAATAAGQALALMEGAVLLASVRRSREPLDHAQHAVRHLLGTQPAAARTA